MHDKSEPRSNGYTQTILAGGEGDLASPTAVALDGSGNVYIADATNARVLKFTPGAGNFGTVLTGHTSAVISMVFVLDTGGYTGSPIVSTTGGASDFSDAGTGSCNSGASLTNYLAGDSCTVDVIFSPSTTGARTGTVQLDGVSGNLQGVGASSITTTPVITSLTPASVKAGSQGFNLVVAGSNFGVGPTVLWNGSARTTTAVSGGLQIAVTAADVASQGTANVTVISVPGLGGTSSDFTFEIDSAASAPALVVNTTNATINVAHGNSGTVTVTFTGNASTAAITATCVNLPLGATCSYNNGAS